MNLKIQLIKNFIVSYLSTFVSVGIQFVFIPFLIIGIGISNYGVYTLFLFFSLTGGLSLFDFGLQGTVVKLISGSISSGNIQKTTSYITQSAVLFLLLGLIFSALVFIINFLFFDDLFNIENINRTFILVFSIFSALNLFIDFVNVFSAAIYEATMRRDYLDTINTIKSVFFVLCVFLFFTFLGKSLSLILYITVFTNIFFTIISLYFAYRLVKLDISNKFVFNWSELSLLLKQSRVLFLSRFVGFLDNQFPRILVSVILPISSLGVYDIIIRIVGIIRMFGSKISQIGLIGLSSILQERDDRLQLKLSFIYLTRISFLFIIPLILVVFFYIESFLKVWLKSEYIEIETIVRLYLIQLTLTNFIAVGGIMLIGLNKVKVILKLSLFSFLVTTCFSVFATYNWGIFGLAASTTFFSLIFVLLYLHKLLVEFNVTFQEFYKKVLHTHIILSIVFVGFLFFLYNSYKPKALFDVFLIVCTIWLSYVLSFFIFGFNKQEKIGFLNQINNVIGRVKQG
jgi:O-antigen/teichoic acid export membrane protein